MSYFRKMVERTLKLEVKADNGSVKPAIRPESIPEPIKTNARVGTRTRRISTSNTSEVVKKKPADAAGSAPDAKATAKEERLPAQQQVVVTTAAATPVSPTKQVAQPAPQKEAGAPDQIMMPDNGQAEVPIEEGVEEEEEEEEPIYDFAAAAAAAAAPAVLHEATEFGRADPASQTRPLKHNGLISNDSLGLKHHPLLRPATRANDKYSLNVTQPDETTVTINIGRIEVRAISPDVEAPLLPRKEYSPPLSLDEYLRQRMEGKKK